MNTLIFIVVGYIVASAMGILVYDYKMHKSVHSNWNKDKKYTLWQHLKLLWSNWK